MPVFSDTYSFGKTWVDLKKENMFFLSKLWKAYLLIEFYIVKILLHLLAAAQTEDPPAENKQA